MSRAGRSDGHADEYRLLRQRLYDVQGQSTQPQLDVWTPDYPVHAALATHAAFITPKVQEAAELEARIQELETVLFPDRAPPSIEELLPDVPVYSVRERQRVEPGPLWTICPAEIPVGVGELVQRIARDDLNDTGYRPLGSEPVNIQLGDHPARVHQVGPNLLIRQHDAEFEVVDRAPRAWLLRSPTSSTYQLLHWGTPLKSGRLEAIDASDRLYALAPRSGEPAYCAVNPNGRATWAMENGFAFDRDGHSGVVDLTPGAPLTWRFKEHSASPFAAYYEAHISEHANIDDVTWPMSARVESLPVRDSGETAFRFVNPADDAGSRDAIGWNGRVYFATKDEARAKTSAWISADEHVAILEKGPPPHFRLPAERESLNGSAQWAEHEKVCWRTPATVAGLTGSSSIVFRGRGPVRLERPDGIVTPQMYRATVGVQTLVVDARDEPHKFWRLLASTPEGDLYRTVPSAGEKAETSYWTLRDRITDGPLPSSLFGGTSPAARVLIAGRLHDVIHETETQLLTEPTEPEPSAWPYALFTREGGRWKPASSGLAAGGSHGPPLAWLDGEPYFVDGDATSGPFRIYQDRGACTQRIVEKTPEGLRVCEGAVPNFVVSHQDALHHIALRHEDLAESKERLMRILLRDGEPSDPQNRLGVEAVRHVRRMLEMRVVSYRQLLAAFDRGDLEPVGGLGGITGAELRRAIGAIEDNPFAVWVRDVPDDGFSLRQPVHGNDYGLQFPGDPELLSVIDKNGDDASKDAMRAFFDSRIRSLDKLTRISVPAMAVRLVAIGGAPTIELTWEGESHQVAIRSEDAGMVSGAAAEALGNRLRQLSPKLVRELAAWELTLRGSMGNLIFAFDGAGTFFADPDDLVTHRVSSFDHELFHAHTRYDRELQLLAVIALKLGPPPRNLYAKSSIGEVLTTHWQDAVINPGGALGANEALDRLALAIAVDETVGPAPFRRGLAARVARASLS